MRQLSDVSHRLVIAPLILAPQEAEPWQVAQRLNAGAGERRTMPEKGQPKESIQPDKARQPGVLEGSVDQQVVRLRARAGQAVRSGEGQVGPFLAARIDSI